MVLLRSLLERNILEGLATYKFCVENAYMNMNIKIVILLGVTSYRFAHSY
jgi:hypothetical protein